MLKKTAAPAASAPSDLEIGQRWFRIGFGFGALSVILMALTGVGPGMFQNKALDLAIFLASCTAATFFTLSNYWGNRLGTSLTWMAVALMWFNGLAFLLVPAALA